MSFPNCQSSKNGKLLLEPVMNCHGEGLSACVCVFMVALKGFTEVF